MIHPNMENIHEKIQCAVFLEKGLAAVTRGHVRLLLIAPYLRLEANAVTDAALAIRKLQTAC